MSEPTVVIHGGAGRALTDEARDAAVRKALAEILDQCWTSACRGDSALEIVEGGCRALEDSPHFNAGLGSAIQGDGQVRMSASVMDGQRRAFSGVINVERVQNPVSMASHLQSCRDRVLDGSGGRLLAREMGLPVFDPVVERRLREWFREMKKSRASDQAAVAGCDEGEDLTDRGMGTVGVVVRDLKGRLAAGTSTGGRGFERIGRVSDSATVAGNYATEWAAISCTGIGEDIADEALAARIAVLVEAGRALPEVMQEVFEGGARRSRRFAAIAVDRQGQMAWGKTTELLLAVCRGTDGEQRWAF